MSELSTIRLVLIAGLVLAGCTDDQDGTTRGTGGAGAVAGAAGSETSGGSPGTGGASVLGGAGGAGGVPAVACGAIPVEAGFVEVPASDAGIRYVGRLDFTDPDAPRLAFPAVTIETLFEGDAIDLRLDEAALGGDTRTAYYDVSIDGGVPIKLETCSAQEVYPLARNLAAGTHRVRISKRTEAQVGTATFLGFRVREGTTLTLPEAPARRLEFIGDSITCGFGNEVSTTDPDSFPFTSTNENALLAYGALTAAALEADYVAVAALGRGMVRNYDGGSGPTVPEFYDLTAPIVTWPAWDHARYEPDVIVVNLGTNDFSIGLTTEELATMRESYRQTYGEFLTHLRELHAAATLIAVVGPMMSDSYPPGYQAWTNVRADVQEVVAARVTAGDANVYYFALSPQTSPYGEDWHPTVATHQRMADDLGAFIQETKGW